MFGPFSSYVRPYRVRLLLGVLAIGIAQAASNYIPMVVKEAIDTLQTQHMSEAMRFQDIQTDVLGVVLLALLVALCSYAMRILLGRASARIEYDIRTAYFAHLLKQPLSYYQTQHTGDLMSRATNDLNSVRIFFTYGVRGIVESGLIFLFSIGWMCYLDWQLALIILAPVPIFVVLLTRMATLVHNRFSAIQDFFGEMSNYVQENLAGSRVIKAYVQGTAQNETFSELNNEYLEKNRRLIQTRASYRPLTHLVASVCLGINLWLGGKAVIEGSFSLGAFVAFNAYLTQLIRPIMYSAWVIDRFQRALVAIRRINEVMDVEPEIRDRNTQPVTHFVRGEIEFRSLTFAYGDNAPVLHDVNLRIPAGTTVGIMGRVGSGKTTLARLIPRLIQSGSNQLFIDGVPIEKWPLSQLRSTIGYVSQNPFLFSNTISANISYGVDSASDAEIHQAAEWAQLRKDVVEFDSGFETLIGERGVTLSGGQKQRSTLARALLRQPQILILDDSLSAVDTHTEEAVLGHLSSLMKGRTTLIIAHRISTLRDCNHIIVLDEGRIAEQGTHGELLKHGGFYADLHARQQLAAELETL
ncbi:MAG: ABC transporter ATP-binding protein [Candidatus Latescibacterota bacterium]|nr:ABC transporter ATP-binding protein [Candidatus Latescibacterota bacterium]MEE2727614.1 ABC transporter ATP-binding protein [Candidatus Latescibacterota bacterium]